MAKKENKNKWVVIASVLAGLVVLSLVFAGISSLLVDSSRAGNVALIKVDGPIAVGASSAFEKVASSNDIVKLIKEADDNPSVKALIIDINSPGGSAVASDEIGRAIKEANKTTIAVIREVGASGGYWVASSADYIIANRMSITGSIGVIGSYLEFAGFLDQYNVTYQRLVSGKYKDAGSPFKELSDEEEGLIQDILDEIHNDFITTVAENRDLPYDDVKEMATGMVFTGKNAKDLGLVDELGGIEEAKDYLNRTLNITPSIVEYKKPATFGDLLSKILSEQSYAVGQGIAGSVLDSDSGIRI